MNRLPRDSKAKISQFRAVTGASEKVANDCLKMTSWAVEQAVDYFYSAGLSSSVPSLDMNAIESLFMKYKGKNSDMIEAEGVAQFCEDLGVDPADIVMLVISFYMNAATMCEYSKEEFTGGLVKMSTDSLDKLKRKLPELRGELKNDDKFRDVYNYAYLFSREKGQKCVQLDTAIAMWQLLFSGEREWKLIGAWSDFLQKHHKHAISKDTWAQLYEFAKLIKPDFSNFDEAAAWPWLIDEFVSHMKEAQ
mmetsp:Transcript_37086/g.82489  ORF Transcript_37086/g.82489 Transcript_37086/m.82489 type:complete len:249 (-) Transcript_37086:1223-1969(-)|eukprot:CAMPEP_0202894778 /NCGR_PEP_ID=MMETSP1392-20130828/4101_1 /ASSEMBLY_ACC=CAM_ASM_000868 /TAXON_ID=225041 /ORGANISM="Chlamydomonas chlamydogama, Strain SAG 11-48b" /LENGTH=248 /DNA_ID=CAMNT_0049579567 /DNA_START=126 /DNA_END=872 /DNA_ORIENTATION=-